MQLKHNHTLRLLAVLAAGVILAGCSQTKTAEAPAKKQEAVQKDEYVRVNSLGSWIPHKVKKGTVPKDDGSVWAVSGENMENINNSGRTSPPPVANGMSKAAASGL